MKNKITPYKNRFVSQQKPVKVYRNLRHGGVVYSVTQNGLVVGHATELQIENCRSLIHHGIQLKVCTKGVRQVHAYLVGMLSEREMNPTHAIRYNPFEFQDFFFQSPQGSKIGVSAAAGAVLTFSGVYVEDPVFTPNPTV